jgi:hypothetical protein
MTAASFIEFKGAGSVLWWTAMPRNVLVCRASCKCCRQPVVLTCFMLCVALEQASCSQQQASCSQQQASCSQQQASCSQQQASCSQQQASCSQQQKWQLNSAWCALLRVKFVSGVGFVYELISDHPCVTAVGRGWGRLLLCAFTLASVS